MNRHTLNTIEHFTFAVFAMIFLGFFVANFNPELTGMAVFEVNCSSCNVYSSIDFVYDGPKDAVTAYAYNNITGELIDSCPVVNKAFTVDNIPEGLEVLKVTFDVHKGFFDVSCASKLQSGDSYEKFGVVNIDSEVVESCIQCNDDDNDGFSPDGDECGLVDCDDSNFSINHDASELCNGVDDDCDGSVDEGDVCDECSVDFDCDDGLFCNGVESCVAGSCVNGSLPAVDDGVACTVDGCDELNDTFIHIADDSVCIDGLFCNGVEYCDVLVGCQLGVVVDCDDNISCTVDSCDDVSDSCVNYEVDADNDGFSVCDGVLNDCDDGNASINVNISEVCNLVDDDCDGSVDEGCDDDLDLFIDILMGGDDCNDSSNLTNPDATDVCGNGIDEDCSGSDLSCPISSGGSLKSSSGSSVETVSETGVVPSQDVKDVSQSDVESSSLGSSGISDEFELESNQSLTVQPEVDSPSASFHSGLAVSDTLEGKINRGNSWIWLVILIVGLVLVSFFYVRNRENFRYVLKSSVRKHKVVLVTILVIALVVASSTFILKNNFTGFAVKNCSECLEFDYVNVSYLGSSNDSVAFVYSQQGNELIAQYNVVNGYFVITDFGDSKKIRVEVGKDKQFLDFSCNASIEQGMLFGDFKIVDFSASVDEICLIDGDKDLGCEIGLYKKFEQDVGVCCGKSAQAWRGFRCDDESAFIDLLNDINGDVSFVFNATEIFGSEINSSDSRFILIRQGSIDRRAQSAILTFYLNVVSGTINDGCSFGNYSLSSLLDEVKFLYFAGNYSDVVDLIGLVLDSEDGCGYIGEPGCVDYDGDGFNSSNGFCGVFDCDDFNAFIFPGAVEVCDGLDNDCDDKVDEAGVCHDKNYYCDEDNDTFISSVISGICTSYNCVPENCSLDPGGDCDDHNAGIYLGALEVCDDGVDNDCDGLIDLADSDCSGFVVDYDGDGFNSSVDCDDFNASIFPGAVEVCDFVDNDCDGIVDEGCDDDGDGFVDVSMGGTDCDDDNASINPFAFELCNGVDDNCDGIVDEGCLSGDDRDDDGFNSSVDCDDFNASIYPGAPEVCGNGIDEDCDGSDKECSSGGGNGGGSSSGGVSSGGSGSSSGGSSGSGLVSSDEEEIIEDSGLIVSIFDVPSSVIIDDFFVVKAKVKNAGGNSLSDVWAFLYLDDWSALPVSVGLLSSGEEKTVEFLVVNDYCSFEKDSFEFDDYLNVLVFANNSEARGYDESVIDLVIPDFAALYDVDINVVKACFVINNEDKPSTNKAEIEFGVYDGKSALLLDYITNLAVLSDEIFIKTKEYELSYIPESKAYLFRAELYDKGSTFKDDYLRGEAESFVELPKVGKSFWERLFPFLY